MKEYTPKFSIGENVVSDLGSTIVLYRVTDIKYYDDNIEDELYYVLKGIEILSHKNTYIYPEAKGYNPICHFFDLEAKLYLPNSIKFIKNLD